MELGFEFKYKADNWSEAFGISEERGNELRKQLENYVRGLVEKEGGFTMSKAIEDIANMGRDNRESLYLVVMFGKLMGAIDMQMEMVGGGP